MIVLGPGGTAGLGYDEGLNRIHELGLGCLEVEFTYGVRMAVEEARRIGVLARKFSTRLSVHAPYYINLASREKDKVEASRRRILDSCQRAHYLGAEYVVFHAGFYGALEKGMVYEVIRHEIQELNSRIRARKWRVTLAPELTGKPSQFGDLDELLQLKKEAGGHLTVDFSHWKARTQGKMNYAAMFDQISFLKHIHAHFSGIEFSAKGERRHLLTPEKEMADLLREALARKVDITIINESPDPIGDSVKSLQILKKLKSGV